MPLWSTVALLSPLNPPGGLVRVPWNCKAPEAAPSGAFSSETPPQLPNSPAAHLHLAQAKVRKCIRKYWVTVALGLSMDVTLEPGGPAPEPQLLLVTHCNEDK